MFLPCPTDPIIGSAADLIQAVRAPRAATSNSLGQITVTGPHSLVNSVNIT